MIHSAWIIFAAIVITFFCSIVAFFSGLINPSGKFTNGTIRFWAFSILKIASIKVEIEGLEKLKPNQPYVFMANHQSTFDIMTCLAVMPGTARFLAKQELFRIPIFAQAMRAVGMIPIDRGNSQKARKSLDEAVQIVKKGVSVIIFPEGTRTRDGNIQNFKKGGFILAMNGGIPIAPVVLTGAMQIMHKKDLYMRKGTIRIDFLNPIETNVFNYEKRNELVSEVRNEIVNRYVEINEKGMKDGI